MKLAKESLPAVYFYGTFLFASIIFLEFSLKECIFKI